MRPYDKHCCIEKVPLSLAIIVLGMMHLPETQMNFILMAATVILFNKLKDKHVTNSIFVTSLALLFYMACDIITTT